tara:strand:+ start:918 stop:1805 length:888 start_codon:yes stop_codon:yes gene_type:complete
LPYIFDWYYQSGKSSKNKGAGIGLALTKSFVELHKGTIYAKNNSSSTGVTFTLEIPRKEALFPTLSENNDVDKTDNVWKTTPVNYINDEKIKIKQNRKLILLIDDNPDILQYLESILENEYDLIFSYNGKDGIDKAIKYIPDIIISDIMMPLKSGVDLCHHLKNLLRSRDKLKEYFFSKEATLPELSSTNLKFLDKEKIFLRKLKTENATVDAIAKDIGMSRSSLFRKIKAITGKNINEYIRKVRIEKAAYLIKEEDTTISQAACEVGFNNINYFRRVFKEELGELPSKYKNKNN